MVRAATLLEARGLRERLWEAGRALPVDALLESRAVDVVLGHAGVLAGALAWRGMAEALFRSAEVRLDGTVAWQGGRTGASHGTGGVASVLWRAGRSHGEPAWIERASLGFAYEDTCWVRGTGNWDNGFGRPGYAWCHGAPGIVAMRLAAPGLPFSDGLVREAVEFIASYADDDPDTYCCGRIGRLCAWPLSWRSLLVSA
jgi:hypothetical protein